MVKIISDSESGSITPPACTSNLVSGGAEMGEGDRVTFPSPIESGYTYGTVVKVSRSSVVLSYEYGTDDGVREVNMEVPREGVVLQWKKGQWEGDTVVENSS